MPQPTSPLAFADIRGILARAMASERGIFVRCQSPGHALSLQHRINSFRKADRADSRKLWDPEDPRYDRSSFDAIRISLVGARRPNKSAGETTMQVTDPDRIGLELVILTEETLLPEIEEL